MMSKQISPAETADWLEKRDNFLIITHKRPDGDTIGSGGAITQVLREQGKTAYMLTNPEITPRYLRFVEKYFAPGNFTPDNIIAVDTASVELFPKNADQYANAISLCIDHHGSNAFYAALTCLDADSASCGEVIFDILTAMKNTLSSTTAELLYVALSTDTGCFSFGNTTANTLKVAALLVEAGAPNKELNKLLFRTKTHGRIAIEGMLTAGIEYSFDNMVAIASITADMLKSSQADEDDLEDIAAIPGSIEGVNIGITIRELKSPHDCKISVRTRAPYDAQKICAFFGGGGHKLAAGATIEKTIPEIKQMLQEVLKNICQGDGSPDIF